MNHLVARCQNDDSRNVQEQIAHFQGAQFDGEPAAEPENQERKDRPKIEQHEVELNCADETKAAIPLAEGCRVGDRSEDERDNSPRREVEKRAAPFRGASPGRQVIGQLHGSEMSRPAVPVQLLKMMPGGSSGATMAASVLRRRNQTQDREDPAFGRIAV